MDTGRRERNAAHHRAALLRGRLPGPGRGASPTLLALLFPDQAVRRGDVGALPVLAGREGQHTDSQPGAVTCGGERPAVGSPCGLAGDVRLFLLSFLGRCLSLSV